MTMMMTVKMATALKPALEEGALEEGALEEGALEEGALEEGALEVLADLAACPFGPGHFGFHRDGAGPPRAGEDHKSSPRRGDRAPEHEMMTVLRELREEVSQLRNEVRELREARGERPRPELHRPPMAGGPRPEFRRPEGKGEPPKREGEGEKREGDRGDRDRGDRDRGDRDRGDRDRGERGRAEIHRVPGGGIRVEIREGGQLQIREEESRKIQRPEGKFGIKTFRLEGNGKDQPFRLRIIQAGDEIHRQDIDGRERLEKAREERDREESRSERGAAEKPSAAEARYVFARLDTNFNDKLDPDEWAASKTIREEFDKRAIKLSPPVNVETFLDRYPHQRLVPQVRLPSDQ